MTKRAISKYFLFSFLLFALASCGNSGTYGDERDGRAPYPNTPVVDLGEVSRDGCLNLQNFHERFKAFPESTQATVITRSIKTESAESLSAGFQSLLYHSAFVYKEASFREVDLIKKYSHVRQSGCSHVEGVFAEGEVDSFTVKDSSPSHITLFQDAWHRSVTYRYIDARNLEIEQSYVVVDRCPNYQNARVTQLRRFQWDHNGSLQTLEMPRSLLQSLADGKDNLPPDFMANIENIAEDRVAISKDKLQSLMASPLKIDLLKCPAASTRPPGNNGFEDPETDLPTPSP